MTKNRKLTNEEVNTILGVEKYTNNRIEAKEEKYRLMDTMKGIMGEDWYTFKKETRDAIEFMCFLSVEIGVFYAKPETIAAKYGIGKSTVYGALRTLQDVGILEKVHRTSRTQNGLGSALYLVTIHPYFKEYVGYLNLEKKANWKTDWKAETGENAWGSKDEDEKNVPTYSLPSLSSKPKHKVIHSTVYTEDGEENKEAKKEQNEKRSWVKYVPKEINSIFSGLYGEELLTLWRKVTLAVKNVEFGYLVDKEEIKVLGINIFRNLMKVDKKKSLPVNDKCAYVYTAMKNSVQEAVGNLYKETMKFEGTTGFYETVDGDYINAGDAERDYSGGNVNPNFVDWIAGDYQ